MAGSVNPSTGTNIQPAVQPAKNSPPQLTQEERSALYNRLRERMSVSKLAVTAPSGFTAYWARKDDESEIARLDVLGFRVVRELAGQPKKYKAQGARADGTYVMGDVILMEIPTEEYYFYLAENSMRATQMSKSAKEKMIQDLEKQGAPTFVLKRKDK